VGGREMPGTGESARRMPTGKEKPAEESERYGSIEEGKWKKLREKGTTTEGGEKSMQRKRETADLLRKTVGNRGSMKESLERGLENVYREQKWARTKREKLLYEKKNRATE